MLRGFLKNNFSPALITSGRGFSFSNSHPNIKRNTAADLANFPPEKSNLAINFGRQGCVYLIERFGELNRIANPGLFFTIPVIERIWIVDQRQIVIDVAKQNAFTSDNVAVSVAAQLYVHVTDPRTARYKVQQPLIAVMSQAQSALRVAIGKNDLDHLLKDRNSINETVLCNLRGTADQWGVEVSRFEITELTPDKQIQEAMDMQSIAERARRAAVTKAEGFKRAMELEAEGKLISVTLDAKAKKEATELDAEAKKRAIELAAQGVQEAAKALSGVTDASLNYFLTVKYMEMVSDLAKNSKHNTYFMPKDISQPPVVTDYLLKPKSEKD
jgi:regulator of protease activity HflC (stomatin/prohibitin superfamily)